MNFSIKNYFKKNFKAFLSQLPLRRNFIILVLFFTETTWKYFDFMKNFCNLNLKVKKFYLDIKLILI